MRWIFSSLAILALGLAIPLAAVSVFAQTAPQDTDADPELARQRQIVARFVTVLEKNPRRGTALDRIYGFHIEGGTIEAFVKQLRERVANKPDDGAGWMILGLIESQRGHDAAAVEAFSKAKELRRTDAIAAYYLGQCLVLVGQPDKAVAALEEAIERKPAQVDLLEIFQALGRVHQRAQRTEAALAVWSRLEKLFPNDARVQEQIALTLAEEGQLAQSLPRYEALAKRTTDDYRRTTYRLEAADLKVKLNRSSEAIADLEQLLAKLNPESWLFREVRRKIEDVFLRTDDQDGLATYYAAWLEKDGEDVEAMSRLARVLARQGRVPEAQQWLEKALKLAPSRKELRLAFIDQLVDDQRYAEAAQQYAALDKAEANNPDYLRDWGKVVLRDTTRPKEERRSEAERIWRRLVAARPNDPLIATQAADLFRHAEMSDSALELYQKAVALAPTAPQYLEYLGEFYHILKRPDDALATWKKIAAGNQRTATNAARLAEVYAMFGYVEPALAEIAAACELDPKDFSLHLKAAELQVRGEAYAAALASLGRAENLAQNDEEREAVLAQQIKIHTLENKLTELADALAQKTAGDNATHGDLFLLARYREALHEYPLAGQAIAAALAREPNHIRSLAAAARIAEQAGNLQKSADLNRKLAVVDRRSRTEYLEHVAALETQLGRSDEALAAGRELIAAAPGNVETYQFFSDLCFRLNRPDDGLAALRRAIRVNPNEPSLLLSLATALAGQFRTDEAIEVYWQALDKHTQLDEKLSDIARLTDLYLQINHLDRLLERLERFRREADRRREMTICLAQAYQTAGDYGMARQELERLLSDNTRDTQLLLQLSKLAESESDVASAIKYQEQLARLAPGPEAEYRLATLLSRAGDNQAAADIFVRLTAKEEDKEKLLRNIDSLLGAEQYDMALAVLEPKLRENAADWELLYRQGVALARRRPDEAPRRFAALLDLSTSDDELGTAAKNRQARQKAQPATTVSSASAAAAAARQRPLRTDYAYEVRREIGLDPNNYYNPTSTRRPVWTPSDYGQARLAAIGWLFSFAQKDNKADALVAEYKAKTESPTATSRELWNWVYLQAMRADEDELLPATRRLAERGGTNEKLLYLIKLAQRGGELNINSTRAGVDKNDNTPPLAADELAFMLRVYDDVRKMPADPQSNISYYTRSAAVNVFRELARAGHKDDEQRRYRELLDKSNTVEELITALQLVQQRHDETAFAAVFDRLAAKDLQRAESRTSAGSTTSQNIAQLLAQFVGNGQTPIEAAASVLDRFLAWHAAKVNLRHSSPTYRPPSRYSASRQNYVYIWTGNSQRYTALPYPAAGEYFDQQALGFLRTLFEVYRGKDLASDLTKHLDERLKKAPPAEQIYTALALSYVQVWNEDREAGAATLAKAGELAPQDFELRLETARLHQEMGQFDEALAIVDAVAPVDQRMMQQREVLALDLAVRLGDLARARQSAQRLFGLRLDAETQVTLAGQMRRLGMNDESEAVLARAQRQAGSRLSALSALMVQYQAQGQSEIAAQVAYQILRRSRTASAAQTAMGYSTSDSQARTSALRCLAQAGKLKEMIFGAEQQIERTPHATQLYETLLEYYQAAGDAQKLLDLQAKIVAQEPDNAELRYRFGQELYRRGKVKEACDEYLVVLKKQPRLISNRYWEMQNAFQRAQREADLVRVLSEMDLRSLGQPYIVTNLLNNMLNNQQSRAAAMVLFKKAWETFPDQRSSMMSGFYDDALWKNPDVQRYGKESLLPTAGVLRSNVWHGVGDGMSYENDGRVNSVLSRVLDAHARSNQLGNLRAEVAAKVEELPRWRGGRAMLAVIDLRLGQPIDASAAFQPLLEEPRNDYSIRQARWIFAQELEAKAATKDLAIELYERACAVDDQDINNQLQYSPAQRLVHLYEEAGRLDDARAVLLKAAFGPIVQDGNYSYRLSRKADDLNFIGGLLLKLNQPVDALRVYRELLVNPEYNDPQISNYSGRNYDQIRGRARSGMEAAMKKLAAKPRADHLRAFLAPAGKSAAGGSGAIDLMLAAMPVGTNPLPTLDTPVLAILRTLRHNAELAAAMHSQLASLAEQHPQDMAVQIALALAAVKGGDSQQADAALTRLARLVEATPLEELPAGKRANSRQRTAAAPQIGLWLLARECLNDAGRRKIGEALAARAVAAAQRQLDTGELTAIMYEHGKLALGAGDRAAAEEAWNRLIDLTLVEPRKHRPVAATPLGVRAIAAPQAAVARPARVPAPTNRSGPIPATLSQFKLAAAISQAAAESNLVGVSLRAMREALSGGVPVADLPTSDARGRSTAMIRLNPSATSSRGDIDETVFTEITTSVWRLSHAWSDHDFPPADVCKLLESLVLPADRPGDVLLFEQSLANDISNPQSVGRLLVDWAVRCGRAAEIEKQLAQRQASPSDALGGLVLRVQLAVKRQQPEKAAEHLAEIHKQLEGSKLNTLSNLAIHAVAAVYGDERLLAAALPLLDRIVTTPAPLGRSISFGAPRPLSPPTILVRQHLRSGETAKARAAVDRIFQARQELYARFSGDSSTHQQKVDLAWAANELARGGNLAMTLEALGRCEDVTLIRDYYNEAQTNTSVAVWHLERQASRLKSAQRYELLKSWTLPSEKRRSIRALGCFDRGQPIPAEFVAGRQDAEPSNEKPTRTAMSNLTLLVEAAAEAGKLEELAAAIEPLEKEKIAGASSLATLVLIAGRDYAAALPRLDAQAEQARQANRQKNSGTQNRDAFAADNQPPAKLEWPDYLVADAALAVPELRSSATRLAEAFSARARRANQTDMLNHLAYAVSQSLLLDLSPAERGELAGVRLQHWTDGGSAAQVAGWQPPAYVASSAGHLVRHAVNNTGTLVFNRPLTGEFEFSFDGYSSADSRSGMGYGGIAHATSYARGPVAVSSAGLGLQVNRPPAVENRSGWNRYRLSVTPSAIRFYCNDRLSYEDASPSRTSPWLVLNLFGRSQAVKNLRLAGNPTVPSEVKLIEGGRLEGWNASFYQEKTPARLRDAERAAERNPDDEAEEPDWVISPFGDYVQVDRSAGEVFDWQAAEGVLSGRVDRMAGESAGSRLYYHRPLAAGDRVAYEFFHEPGQTHVHPTLGQVAFLLEPSGVKLHWMTPTSDMAEPLLVDPRNSIDAGDARRGPAELPLKRNDWNAVELAIRGDLAVLSLNGEMVCERPIDANSDRRFGLFHYKSATAAKVRNVVLRGNWPQTLTAAEPSDLLAPERAISAEKTAWAEQALVGEAILTTAAYDVWLAAQEMAPADRYAYLKAWVLPSESHVSVRLQIDWSPSDVFDEQLAADDARKVHADGQLVAPALELVTVAKQLGKLNELAAAAAAAAKEFPDQARPLAAFGVLLALARGDDQAAIAGLKQAIETIKKQPAQTPPHERHAEYLAAYAALASAAANPAARLAAKSLALEIANDQRPPRNVNPTWARRVVRLRSLANWRADQKTAQLPFGQSTTLGDWQPVTRSTAEERGEGYPAGAWKLAPGEATCLSGSPRAALYYAVPLTGDFEVSGQITTAANRTNRLVYGGFALAVGADGKQLIRQELGRSNDTRTPLFEKPARWGPTVEYTLAVKDGLLTASINGQQVHSERLPAKADPWLAIETTTPNQTGAIKSLRINGTPTVPKEIDLCWGSALEGWRADYYGEEAGASQSRGGPPPEWKGEEGEIRATRLAKTAGSFRESVLQYHRPLLEDGQIEYEFFYEPGKTEVHPALDRLAFLLSPDGVKLHRLTDAQYDRSGQKPDNAEPLPGSWPVPLKAGDWNRLKLAVRGDDIAIEVNGSEVATYRVEPLNDRAFGLFRYADAAGVRVRKVMHRGAWPTMLPPLAEQSLAAGETKPTK